VDKDRERFYLVRRPSGKFELRTEEPWGGLAYLELALGKNAGVLNETFMKIESYQEILLAVAEAASQLVLLKKE